jgi:hypothetical protein
LIRSVRSRNSARPARASLDSEEFLREKKVPPRGRNSSLLHRPCPTVPGSGRSILNCFAREASGEEVSTSRQVTVTTAARIKTCGRQSNFVTSRATFFRNASTIGHYLCVHVHTVRFEQNKQPPWRLAKAILHLASCISLYLYQSKRESQLHLRCGYILNNVRE